MELITEVTNFFTSGEIITPITISMNNFDNNDFVVMNFTSNASILKINKLYKMIKNTFLDYKQDNIQIWHETMLQSVA